MVSNRGLILKQIPVGWPKDGEDLVVEDRPFDLDNTPPPTGGIVVRVHYISFDPYQRGRMRDPSIKSYSPAFQVGNPITNRAVVTVVKSDTDKFKPGDLVVTEAQCGMEEYAFLDENAVVPAQQLNNPYNLDPKIFIGALGMPGLTAYSSFYEIGEPKKGETIFISAASGAVGQLVGQLAKHEGLKVIGSVGDDKKLEFITNDLGFDGGFNYKKEKPADALKRLAPEGLNIYYENVGGEQLEAAINAMNPFGRIIACGMVSQYNLKPKELYPIRNLVLVVGKRLKMQGFIVGDPNMKAYAQEHQQRVSKWIADGSFKAKMSVTEGIENAAAGFLGMLEGKNFGKAILEISPLEQVNSGALSHL
ncbi:NAD(P)-binding protein [Viridothelium virens]|uniref:NAD(P)-binding protein n=1 Tax=Viridothelium virens TaxID=1048519 RepID=A0A6A6H0R7_VIRVR|nr:NAD(P)-binding protein [Viridothelium virens]